MTHSCAHYRRVLLLSPAKRRTITRFLAQDANAQGTEILQTEDLTLMRYVAHMPGHRVRQLTQNPHLPPALQRRLAKRGLTSGAVDLPLELAKRSSLARSVQERLLAHPDPRIRSRMAASPALDPPLQSRILQDSPRVRKHMASSPGLLAEHMLTLSTDPDSEVRAWLATNHQLSPEAQEVLHLDVVDSVLIALVQNTSLLPALQLHFAQSPDEYLRHKLAANTALTPQAASPLSRDIMGVQNTLGTNRSVHLHPLLSASFCFNQRHDALREYFSPCSLTLDEWLTLAENWEGSLLELQEAITLLVP